MMERVLRGTIEFLKQIVLFIIVFSISLIVFSFISATLENAHGAEYNYIKIPNLVLVRESQVYLGDIAEIHLSDVSVMHFASKLNLGAAPLPGRSRFFKGKYLKNLISSRLDSSIKVIVPEQVKVISKTRLITVKEIEEKLIAFLKKQKVWQERNHDKSELVINRNLNVKPISVPDRDIKIDFRVSNNDDLLGATNVELRILDKEKIFKRMWLRVNVSYSGTIVVAQRDLRPGEVLEESMLLLSKVEIDNAPSRFYTRLEDLLGLRAKAFIRKGYAVVDAMVERPPLVSFGDMVEIVADNGVINISASGRALGKGIQGGIIRVQNLNTKKVILATVIGDKKVKVSF